MWAVTHLLRRDYPQLAKDRPDQVQCIFLRNTSATDSTDRFPYDTSGFEGIPQDKFMFFVNANDLSGLDIANGQCYNDTVAQNLTFGYQGLPGGIGDDQDSAAMTISAHSSKMRALQATATAIVLGYFLSCL
jgi:hypothetical protein